MRVRRRTSRPSGASIVPVRDVEPARRRAPGTRARTSRRRSAACSCRCAASPFATSIRPEVSRSRRWTACGSHAGLARGEQLDERHAPVARRRMHDEARRLVDDQRSARPPTRSRAPAAGVGAGRRRRLLDRAPARRRCSRMLFGRGRPSTSTAPASISAAARGARDISSVCGEPGVEARARRVRRAPASSSWRGIAVRPGEQHRDTSSATPATIAMSARLNAGHSGGSRKSIAAPIRTRSARLPSAPPTTSPTGSHRSGRVAWAAK